MVEENNLEQVENTTSNEGASVEGFEIISEEDGSVDTRSSETLTIQDLGNETQETDSSLNNENNSAEPAQSEVEATPEADQKSESNNFINELNKRYDTDFKDAKELDEYLDSADNEPSYSSNEKLNKIDQFVKKTGGTVDEYLYLDSLKFDEMSDEAILKENIHRDNPNLSEDEIDFLFNKKYPKIGLKKDDSGYDEDSVRESQIQLKTDAGKLREEFIEEKNDILSGKYDLNSGEEIKATEKDTNSVSDQEAKQLREGWLTDLDKQTDDLEGIEFTINDKGDSFVYNIPEEDKASLKQHNSNLNNFFNRYVNNGEWDFDKLNTEMYILNNMGKVVKAIANQYSSSGREEVVKDIKNPSYEQPQRSSNSGQSKSVESQLIDSMFSSGRTLGIK
jgi:hypothetical protein